MLLAISSARDVLKPSDIGVVRIGEEGVRRKIAIVRRRLLGVLRVHHGRDVVVAGSRRVLVQSAWRSSCKIPAIRTYWKLFVAFVILFISNTTMKIK